MSLVATTAFGLEAIVKRELEGLGFADLQVSDGMVEFQGDFKAVARANLNLRSADRIYVKIGEFKALTFDELFEGVKALPWSDWIPADGVFPVTGKAVKSILHSVPDCQAITKKAVVESLKKKYGLSIFPENGAAYMIRVALHKDIASLLLDTSGEALHRRGYRLQGVEASLKETLAAALVQLSFWEPGRLLLDPFCGSGTIPIEAALIGREIAPGLLRSFAAEKWGCSPAAPWQEERELARSRIKPLSEPLIEASDMDSEAIAVSEANARRAHVTDDIHFTRKMLNELWIDREYGIVICNPPYGERMGELRDARQNYFDLGRIFRKKTGWSVYVITPDWDFERRFGAVAERKRKLFNGGMEVTYYQYFGRKPK
ncbi:MAG: class I SAM-dependent RNA methyltransferase [Candidatus Wallbacteria bacterium]|nr:class I SAM-dependent RNA methyltransferase [Candidatus Wallbacteria bacterium]